MWSSDFSRSLAEMSEHWNGVLEAKIPSLKREGFVFMLVGRA